MPHAYRLYLGVSEGEACGLPQRLLGESAAGEKSKLLHRLDYIDLLPREGRLQPARAICWMLGCASSSYPCRVALVAPSCVSMLDI